MKLFATLSLFYLSQALDLSDDLEVILDNYQGVGLTAWSVETDTGAVCTQGAAGSRINANITNNDFVLEGDSRHHVGSVTKSMTASLLAIILEQAKPQEEISATFRSVIPNTERFEDGWDTTLDQALPDMDTGNYGNVTLRLLVSMLSGIPDGPSAPTETYGTTFYPVDADAIRLERRLAVQDALHLEPSAPAGTNFEYSNWNFMIAGHIIEETLNMSWEEALKTMLFEPLGFNMELDDMFGPVPIEREPAAHYLDNELIPCDPEEDVCDNPAVIGPAGTVSVPVAAMARYLSWHVECHKGRDNSILSQQACMELHSPPEPDITPYGYGWVCLEMDVLGGQACNHNGSNLLNFYLAWISFNQDRAYVGYTNSARDSDGEMVDDALALGVQAHLFGTETCDDPWESRFYETRTNSTTSEPTPVSVSPTKSPVRAPVAEPDESSDASMTLAGLLSLLNLFL